MLQYKTGTYTGDGNTTKAITGIGFQPKVVIVFATVGTGNASAGLLKSDTHSTGATGDYMTLGASENVADGAIDSLDSDGFTVRGEKNLNATTYYYIALAGSDVVTGTYIGDVSDNRSITGIGFQPEWVVIKGEQDTRAYQKTNSSGISVDASVPFDGVAETTDKIQALEADGFQIGLNGLNDDLVTYHYVAIKSGSGFTTGSYTGNGTTQTISSIGFDPKGVIIKSQSTQVAMGRTDAHSGDLTSYFAPNTAPTTGAITALGTDSFDLGSSGNVNSSGQLYYYIALGNKSVTITPATQVLTVSTVSHTVLTYPLTDDFNRADNTTVGNNWAEGGVASFEISNNELLYPGFGGSGSSIYRNIGKNTGIRIKMRAKFAEPSGAPGDRNEPIWILSKNDGSTYNSGIGLKVVQSDVPYAYKMWLVDNDVQVSSAIDLTIVSNAYYTFELIIDDDNSMQGRYWRTNGGSRPGSANVEKASFTPNANGNNVAVAGYTDWNSFYWVSDNYDVSDSPNAKISVNTLSATFSTISTSIKLDKQVSVNTQVVTITKPASSIKTGTLSVVSEQTGTFSIIHPQILAQGVIIPVQVQSAVFSVISPIVGIGQIVTATTPVATFGVVSPTPENAIPVSTQVLTFSTIERLSDGGKWRRVPRSDDGSAWVKQGFD